MGFPPYYNPDPPCTLETESSLSNTDDDEDASAELVVDDAMVDTDPCLFGILIALVSLPANVKII